MYTLDIEYTQHDSSSLNLVLQLLLVIFLQNKDAYAPFCKVPLVTSSKEEQRLIATANKVKILYNLSHFQEN